MLPNPFYVKLKPDFDHFQFHQDFSVLLASFKDECRRWANNRSSELECVCFQYVLLGPFEADHVPRLVTASMASVSLDDSHKGAEEANALPTPVSPHRDLPHINAPGVGLPPPSSDDWEEVALPPPPPSTRRPRTRSTTRGGR